MLVPADNRPCSQSHLSLHSMSVDNPSYTTLPSPYRHPSLQTTARRVCPSVHIADLCLSPPYPTSPRPPSPSLHPISDCMGTCTCSPALSPRLSPCRHDSPQTKDPRARLPSLKNYMLRSPFSTRSWHFNTPPNRSRMSDLPRALAHTPPPCERLPLQEAPAKATSKAHEAC